ncbi:hypothetical protein D3C72_2522010 [compost metagenome]
MAFEIEQAQLKGREQPAGARADDDDIGGDFSGHFVSKSVFAGAQAPQVKMCDAIRLA